MSGNLNSRDLVPQRLLDWWAAHGDDARGTVEVVAQETRLAMAEIERILADPEAIAVLEAHRTAQEITGGLLPHKVRRALGKVVEALEVELSKSGTDGFAAVELSKPLLRLHESLEKTRLAEREGTDNLPVFNFIFENGGVQATLVHGGGQVPRALGANAFKAAPTMSDGSFGKLVADGGGGLPELDVATLVPLHEEYDGEAYQ